MKRHHQLAWLVLVAIQAIIVGLAHGCSFDGLLASCHMTVGGIPVQASARINHCHTPVDITFLLQGAHDYSLPHGKRHDPLSWQYTYVTANQPESQEIPGSDRRIMLHIVADAKPINSGDGGGIRGPATVSVKAQFLVDGNTSESLKFLDEDSVRIPHFEDCIYQAEEDQVGKIAMGCIITIILLCFLALLGLGFYNRTQQRYRNNEDQVNLVSNMERHQQQHQQRCSSSSGDPTGDDFNIHYVVPSQDGGEGAEGESGAAAEPKVYVSTPNGLKKVERRESSSGSSTSSRQTGHSPKINTNGNPLNPLSKDTKDTTNKTIKTREDSTDPNPSVQMPPPPRPPKSLMSSLSGSSAGSSLRSNISSSTNSSSSTSIGGGARQPLSGVDMLPPPDSLVIHRSLGARPKTKSRNSSLQSSARSVSNESTASVSSSSTSSSMSSEPSR